MKINFSIPQKMRKQIRWGHWKGLAAEPLGAEHNVTPTLQDLTLGGVPYNPFNVNQPRITSPVEVFPADLLMHCEVKKI